MGGTAGACDTGPNHPTQPDMGGGWFVRTADGMVRTAGPALIKEWTVGTAR